MSINFYQKIGFVVPVTFKNGETLSLSITRVEGNKIYYIPNSILGQIDAKKLDEVSRRNEINDPKNHSFFYLEDIV